ncbi:hypothetical protein ACFL6S_14445 [Candidatus Poribacteria bacterium]
MMESKEHKLTLNSSVSTQLRDQETEQRLEIRARIRPEIPRYKYPPAERKELMGSEERQLMLRLEELARIEGLREDKTIKKIPATTQALIDSKVAEDEVLRHDGSVQLSADWEIGSGRRILSGGKGVDCPTYISVKATSQPEGDLHLSDASSWGVSKALIKMVRVITSSTNWDMYILQNDNGYAIDDANIPKMQIMGAGNGNANIHLDLPYEDEDDTNEVHLYYSDNSGSSMAGIYVIGYEMV